MSFFNETQAGQVPTHVNCLREKIWQRFNANAKLEKEWLAGQDCDCGMLYGSKSAKLRL